ncbi:MAG: hypothetical protein WC934_13630 [Acidithiobacillus sp.]|jgi:hypothetical protein|uniref:hypothetical protein n=1 Tax=Acidithiobacillus sp. TaxID=1872118 RepID=UPI00355E555E
MNTKNINGLSNEHYLEISELDYEKLRIFLKQKSKQLSLPTIMEPNEFVYGIKYLEAKERTYYLIFYQKKDTKQLHELWPNEFSINPETTLIIDKETKEKYKVKQNEKELIKEEEEIKDIEVDIAESVNKNPKKEK